MGLSGLFLLMVLGRSEDFLVKPLKKAEYDEYKWIPLLRGGSADMLAQTTNDRERFGGDA